MREKENKCNIIIGIDPGTRVTGYGIISQGEGSGRNTAIDYGCISPPAHYKLSERYLILFNALEDILDRFKPDALAVETQYVDKNIQSVLKLGQARGIAIVCAKRRGIPVFEYSPSSVKKAVGSARATKEQVQELVKLLLGLHVVPEPHDAADALAVALCHSNASLYRETFDKEI